MRTFITGFAICAAGGFFLFHQGLFPFDQPHLDAVKSQLVDPDSAQFRNVRKVGVTYCGEYNAKNRMGGFTGWAEFAAIETVGGPWHVMTANLGEIAICN